MAKYVLDKNFELVGYKGLPFGVRCVAGGRNSVEFFNREQYKLVLMLDGMTEIDLDTLSEAQQRMFSQMLEKKSIHETDGSQGLLPRQQYRAYPAVYKEHIQWSITGACNYKCRHCFMSAPDCRFTEPTWEQCKSAIHQMAECGITDISITGGEPLISPHLYKIFDECIQCGVRISTIYTNGKLLTADLLDELEKRGMHPSFQMSYDGIGWHDWLRGVEGAEKAVLDAFALCRERGFRTSAALSLHRHNLEGFNESLRLLDSLGVSHCKSNITSPTGLWAKETEHFLDPDETYQYLIENAIPEYMADGLKIGVQFCTLLDWDPADREGYIPAARFSGKEESRGSWSCGAIKNGGYLSPEGYVLPCMTMIGTAVQGQFESVYDRPMSEILSESAFTRCSLMKMGEVIDSNKECMSCEYKYLCGAGCRACATGETGTDIKAIDKEMCHFFKAGWYEKSKTCLENIVQHKKDHLTKSSTE